MQQQVPPILPSHYKNPQVAAGRPLNRGLIPDQARV